MVALFRIVELESGSISIDDVDISKLALNDIRNAISIIPQDFTLCTWNCFECVGVVLTSMFFFPSLWDSAVQLGSIWTAR